MPETLAVEVTEWKVQKGEFPTFWVRMHLWRPVSWYQERVGLYSAESTIFKGFYLFPTAAIRNLLKLGDLKQHKYVLLWFWNLKSEIGLAGSKGRCQRAGLPAEALGTRASLPLLFSELDFSTQCPFCLFEAAESHLQISVPHLSPSIAFCASQWNPPLPPPTRTRAIIGTQKQGSSYT